PAGRRVLRSSDRGQSANPEQSGRRGKRPRAGARGGRTRESRALPPGTRRTAASVDGGRAGSRVVPIPRCKGQRLGPIPVREFLQRGAAGGRANRRGASAIATTARREPAHDAPHRGSVFDDTGTVRNLLRAG